MTSSNPNDQWLVKSGDHILGPFTTAVVVEKVRSKELVVIDEISQPRSRWRYIRDVPAFAAIVEEVRRGHAAAREDTEVQGYTTTDTKTHASVEPIKHDSGVTPTSDLRIPMDSGQIRDAEFTETPRSKLAAEYTNKKISFGLPPPPVREKRKLGPAFFTGAIVLGMSLVFILWTATQKQKPRSVLRLDAAFPSAEEPAVADR